jgi:hypothetical protein
MVGTNQVACIADDGQVTFELAHLGACNQDGGRHADEPTTASTIDVERGDGCTDLALLQPAWRDRGAGDDTQHALQAGSCAWFVFSAVPDVCRRGRVVAPHTVDLASTALTARLTIVLLV